MTAQKETFSVSYRERKRGGPLAGCYLRVSTGEQDARTQRAELERLCEARGWTPIWYEDHGLSGGTTERPAYQQMMEDARLGNLRVVAVWKIDRLGRTVLQLVGDLDNFRAWGVDLVSCRDQVDTTTPMGRAMFGIIGVFAELEREMISERTRAKYLAKKARAENLGQRVKWGRRPKDVPAEVVDAIAAGMSQRQAAEQFGVSRRIAAKAARVARNRGAPEAPRNSPENSPGPESVDSVPQEGGEGA